MPLQLRDKQIDGQEDVIAEIERFEDEHGHRPKQVLLTESQVRELMKTHAWNGTKDGHFLFGMRAVFSQNS